MSLFLAVALVGITSLTLAALLLPLIVRQRGPASRETYNLAVYRDQLAEVERDTTRGVLATREAEAARAEIGRRILALKPDASAGAGNPGAAVVSVLAILSMPVAALLIYGALGSPELPDRPFADRGAASAANANTHLDINKAVAQLRDHLKTHPDDLTGWLLLARSDVGMDHYKEATEAYRHAADLSGHRADILGDYGEAQVLAAGGKVTPGARAAFTAALKDPETAPRSRYYLALARMQDGDARGALKDWLALAADSPADAAWLPLVRRQIAAAAAKLGIPAPSIRTAAAGVPASATPSAAGMPSPAAVASAQQALQGSSPEQRQTMIAAMVERLAARLQKQPDDAVGWAQLGRSYMVLHQPEKARAAYQHAVKLRPDDMGLKADLAQAGKAAEAPVQSSPSR